MVPIPLVVLVLVVELAVIFSGVNLLRSWQRREDRRRAGEERIQMEVEREVGRIIK